MSKVARDGSASEASREGPGTRNEILTGSSRPPTLTSSAVGFARAPNDESLLKGYRKILADVIVYIFAHLHRALRTEGKVLDIN